MKEVFFAKLITFEKGDDSFTVGFSDGGDDPDKYIVMEKSLEFDEQDVDLGMDTYYFEYNDTSDYGVCKKVILKKMSIHFILNEKFIDNVSEITVSFSDKSISNTKEFVEILQNILGDLLEMSNG